ncbi:MAG: DUF2799 domain-containing protein [Pseudomonadota bacterium]
MRRIAQAGLLAAAAALAACGPRPVAPEACGGADWRAVGVADGVRGAGPERLNDHRSSCAAAGVAPDATAWEAGRERGLEAYCTPAAAHREGEQGRPLRPVCPAEAMAALSEANALGRERFAARVEIARIDSMLLAPPLSPWGRWGRYGYRYGYGYGGYYGRWGWPGAWNSASLWRRRAQAEARLAGLPPPPKE